MKHKFLVITGIIAVVAIAAMICLLPESKGTGMSIGIKPENMDMSVRPGDNFFDYATLSWRRANPIPDDYTVYGAFNILNDINMQRVRDIAEADNGKIGTLYKIAMDTDRRNAEKTAPIQPYLDEIDKLQSADDLPEYLGRAHSYSDAFWNDGVGPDNKDSEHYLYNIGQGGTGLTRDYYFDDDENSVKIRKQYREYIAKQMKNFGLNADAEKIYALEERLARAHYTKEKLRDPNANYHKMSVADLKQQLHGFDWDKYITARGAGAAEYIDVGQPEAIAAAISIMHESDFELIRDYLKYNVISAAQTLLDDETYEIAFDFYNRKMAGQQEPKPRWKRAVALLDGTLGEEIGRLYVDKYFSPAAKKRMQQLVNNLKRALKIRIENLEWMSDETKVQALKKLDAFNAKIGYPDKWRDYSKLEIDANISLWENMIRVMQHEEEFWFEKIGTKKDPNIWYMNAHEVNAYYDPSANEVCFPAGILQYPFFDMDADDAFNYGAIGSVIGHEMTHGFDDSGRHFDSDGNLRDWWTDTDAKKFDARANVLREFFDKIQVAPDVYANGEFTLGENLADYGGITVSYTAYKNFGTPSATVNNITPDMRFFIAYAGVWAQNIRDAEILRLTKMDEHSLGMWRVNGILPHIDAWYNAFGIQPDDKMYLAPEKRIKLW